MMMRAMKILFFLFPVFFSCTAVAQFSISKVEPSAVETRARADSVRQTEYRNDFFSKALWEAERRKLRKERNAIELNLGLQGTQTKFVNWAGGGDNTLAARTTLYFRHQHTRERFGLDYKVEARYGFNVIEKRAFKNEDEFKLNVQTTWKMHKNWSYAATANLRSQFSIGYKSRTDSTKVSTFMAPGFFDISVGFNYKKEGSPFNITISPVAGSVVMVLDEYLRENGVGGKGLNGLELGKRSKGQVGLSVRIDFDKEFFKQIFRYRWSLYSFTNIKTPPTVRWENTFEIKATRFLSTTVYALFYYDKYANTPKPERPQLNYSLSVGLSYKITNK